MTWLTILATVSLMIFFNALYVAAEFATVSSRRTKISQMAADGDRLARALLPTLESSEKLDRYVAGCQIGITISSLVLGAYGQNVIAQTISGPVADLLAQFPSVVSLFGGSSATATAVLANSLSITIVLITITTLQVIFGELFPKSIAIQYPERVALSVAWPMKISLKLFAPLIWLFNGSGMLILRLLGHSPGEGHMQVHSAEEIELLVTESHEGGLLDDIERQMLRNAFRLRDLTARQVMLHRTRLVAVSKDSTVLEVLNMAIDEGLSRIPIYDESIDDIVGFVHVKDLFRLYVEGETSLESVMRDVVYVPETMPASDVWEKLTMRAATIWPSSSMNSAAPPASSPLKISSKKYLVNCRMSSTTKWPSSPVTRKAASICAADLLVSDVNEYLDLSLPTEADTLSGLVFSVLGRPPEVGEEVTIDNTIIRVEAMEDLGVREVSLVLPTIEPGTSFSEWEVEDHE